MRTVPLTFEQAARNGGFLLAAALIAFFLLMRVLGLAENLTLRLFNFVILFAGVYWSIRKFRDEGHADHFTYIRGLLTGSFTAVLGSAIFGLFILLYLNVFDTAFMESVREHAPMGPYLNPYIIAVTIWIEGIFSGMIFSFIAMMILTDDRELI